MQSEALSVPGLLLQHACSCCVPEDVSLHDVDSVVILAWLSSVLNCTWFVLQVRTANGNTAAHMPLPDCITGVTKHKLPHNARDDCQVAKDSSLLFCVGHEDDIITGPV